MVGQLVGDDDLAEGAGEDAVAVYRPGLGLERGEVGVDDDGAVGLEGVVAEGVAEELQHVGRVAEAEQARGFQRGLDVVDDGEAVGALRVGAVELRDGHADEVAGDLVADLPGVGGGVAVVGHAGELADGGDLVGVGDRDDEGVGGLVGGVLVERVPGRGAPGLACDEDAGGVLHPAHAEAETGEELGDGLPLECDVDGEGCAAVDGVLRRHRELVAGAGVGRGPVGDAHVEDLQAAEVEVERGEGVGGSGVDGGLAADEVRVDIDVEGDGVVGDVVAAVAEAGVQRVAEARGAGRGLLRPMARREEQHRQGKGCEREGGEDGRTRGVRSGAAGRPAQRTGPRRVLTDGEVDV